jgi:hypothetical protein
VDKDYGARRREGRAIVVESAIELRFRGESRVDAGGGQAQCRGCLLDEAAPEAEGERWISAAQAGHKVVFESAIRAMQVRRD